MMLLWLATALAGDVRVVASDGALHPGLAGRVEVAVTGNDGRPVDRQPRLSATGASIRVLDAVGDGVWAVSVVPDLDVQTVRISAVAPTLLGADEVPVTPLALGTLELPRRIDAVVDDETVSFRVSGDDLPPPEALVVSVSEGEVVGIVDEEGALRVTLRLGDSAYARAFAVGVYDSTRDAAPVWSIVRVRARPRLALRTEPGTSVDLTVGSRSYGPFVAGDDGSLVAIVDQYPGESAAEAVFTDDLGNTTRTTLPLSNSAQDGMVALVGGPIRADGLPPRLFLASRTGSGGVRRASAPECQSPTGKLQAIAIDGDQWVVPLPDQAQGDIRELRLQCDQGLGVTVRPRVPVVSGVGSRVRLRVWPEEVSTDFPVAEVHAVVEDARGERLSTDGLSVTADVGAFEAEETGPLAIRGEYRGRRAITAGQDVVRATYTTPAGGPDVQRIVVSHGPVPTAGGVQVFARALDGQGRPVADVPVQLGARGERFTAQTNASGWAQSIVPIDASTEPLVLTGTARGVVGQAVAVRGTSARVGPSEPDLQSVQRVLLQAGRVDDLVVRVDPPVLYTGSGSVAFVRIDITDRAGGTVADAEVELTASEGEIGELFQMNDGTWRAEYTPPPGDRARDVTLTARSETVSASTRLSLQPRPLIRAPAISLGAITNFGRITSPMLTLDTDWRIPVFGGATILRVGLATYGGVNEFDTGLGGKNTVRMTIVPVQVALLARRELGARALWLGLGGVFAPYAGTSRFNEVVAARGVGVLPPGIVVSGGLGQRFGGGEVTLEARGIALASPGGTVAFQGPVGGVALLIGYRLIY